MASNVSPLHFIRWSNMTSTTAEPTPWTNDTLTSSSATSISLATVVPMTLVYTLIFAAGLVGNVCTCVVIARNKAMHTATNYYLFSLAVSDLLLLVLGLPHELLYLWAPEPYPFGEAVCVLRGLAAETSTNATILTIAAFTVERYVAICHPLRSRTVSKLSRALRLLIAVWLVAAACAVPIAMQFGITYAGVPPDPDTAACNVKTPLPHAFELSTFLFFCLPMTLITVLYLRIAAKLRQSSSQASVKSSGVPCANGEATHATAATQTPTQAGTLHHRFRSTRPVNSSSRKAMIKMLVAVVVAFFLCWAPFHAQRLLAVYASQPPSAVVVAIYNVLTYLSGILYYVSATINPILYHIMSLKFRLAFRDTLARCCGRRSASRPGKCHSLSHFPSTIRSRMTLDTTETTLLNDDMSFGNGHKVSFVASGMSDISTSSVHPRGDSISNSSLRMLDDDPLSPLELSSLMAELNLQSNCADHHRYL